MEHLRLVLSALTSLSLVQSGPNVQTDGFGEYQEDGSDVGLYRSPEEGATAAGAWSEKASASNGPGGRSSNGLGLYQSAEEGTLLGGRGAKSTVGLEMKVSALENIVCVLNREVERTSVTQEAHVRQHRLDQEKIDSLHNKVESLFVTCIYSMHIIVHVMFRKRHEACKSD